MTITRSTGCVYCGRPGPYSDEHVIPAGLGAGDALLLRDLVCKSCNAEFSKQLEVRVLRTGDIGLGRLALQPTGRSRGKKTRAPIFDTASAQLRTEDGRALEIGLGHQLAPEILPHITQNGDLLDGGGTDRTRVQQFQARLERLLKNSVVLVCQRLASTAPYSQRVLTHGPAGYMLAESRTVAKPGANVIWLEAPVPESLNMGPRLYERSRGSIAVQVVGSDATAAAAFLTTVKANLTRLQAAFANAANAVDVVQPQVHVTMHAPDESDVARLLAKTGFNLLLLTHGDLLGRDPSFDGLCSAIRYGTSPLRMKVWCEAEGLVSIMRKVFNGQHWMMLAPLPNPDGGFGLAFGCSLYGGSARLLLLVENFAGDTGDFPVFFAVDYRTHTTHRFSLHQVTAMLQAATTGHGAEG